MTQTITKPARPPELDSLLEKNPVKAPATARVTWVYYLTIFTCFIIVFTHVSAGVILNTTDQFKWWVSNIADSFCRWSLPVFVMMSGFLLLDPRRENTLISFYKRRSNKILIPLIFWSAFYLGFNIIKKYLSGETVTLDNFLNPILTGQPFYHMWYLYMLVGLYLATPFLRKIVSVSTKGELLFLCAILMTIPMINNFVNWFHYNTNFVDNSIFLTWFAYFLGYYLAGYLIGQVLKIEISLIIPIIAFAVSGVITAIGTYVLTTRYSFQMGEYLYSALSPNVIIMALSIFYIAKKLAASAPRFTLLENSYPLMFGIYLLHPFFLRVLSHYGIDAIRFNPVISIPVISIIAFLMCYIVAAIIRKIPYLRSVI